MSDFLDLPEHRETVEQIERRIARVAPSDDLLDRIMAETAPEPVAALDERRARSRRTGWVLGGLAAAAAAVAAIAIVAPAGDTAPASRAALEADGVSGEARLYEPDGDAGRLVVQLDDVPAAPSDHHYEVWVLRRGSDEMEAVGHVRAVRARRRRARAAPAGSRRLRGRRRLGGGERRLSRALRHEPRDRQVRLSAARARLGNSLLQGSLVRGHRCF